LTTALAEHNQTIQALIDNLRTLFATLTKEGDKFSGTIDRIEQLVTQLAAERDPIGTAIESLNNGTASVADLLTDPDRRSPGPSNSSAAWQSTSTGRRIGSTLACSRRLRITASWSAPGRTAAFSTTTSAN